MNMHYQFDWSILLKPQFAQWLLEGLGWTLFIGLFAVLASLVVGALLAMLQALSGVPGKLARLWGSCARCLPCLFWLLLFYGGLPLLTGGYAIPFGLDLLAFGLLCAVLALTVDNATYVADALSDGIRAVPRDERDAAIACGLTERDALCHCVLPQALRFAFPALLNRSVHVLKNTALCMAIGVPEMMWAAQQIESITFRGIEVTVAISVAYVLLGLGLALIAARYQRTTTPVGSQL